MGAILQKSFEIKQSVKRGNTTTSNIFKVNV